MAAFKILDKYILKGFLPLFLMSFLICWFIVLLQFLWRYMDELVGKGLGLWVVGQTIFYAAMSFLPLALPLGILFASLMFFGQIGERLELLAMKASGVPLYRIMAPLFTTVLLLAVGLFYFQNTYMITSQVRMWTLLYSARFANPELEIPERVFYNGIPNYSIYVGQRDKLNPGRMHNLMIYDLSGGNEKTRIIRADSGRIVMDKGQTYLTWKLYGGQSFENMSTPETPSDPQPTSYAKEKFAYKEIVIAFDANFKMQDESDMRNRFVGKNLEQLNYAIDTTTMRIDSIRTSRAKELIELNDRQIYNFDLPSRFDTTEYAVERRAEILGDDTLSTAISLDSILRGANLQDSLRIMRSALASLQQIAAESDSRLYQDKEAFFYYRTNRQEWHRKFTFPVACLVFFFIGAPLGAIIRKGGLGIPVIVSVGFFVFYYSIDTLGHNMINAEKLGVVPGMWMSTFILLPIGVYLTWEATRDSAAMNTEAYVVFFRRLLGTAQVRKIGFPELSLQEVNYPKVLADIEALQAEAKQLLDMPWYKERLWHKRMNLAGWIYSPTEELMERCYHRLEDLVKDMLYTQVTMERAKLQDLPVLMMRIFPKRLNDTKQLRWGLALLSLALPISLPIIALCYLRLNTSRKELKNMQQNLEELRQIILNRKD